MENKQAINESGEMKGPAWKNNSRCVGKCK